jgi:hypothetical protein
VTKPTPPSPDETFLATLNSSRLALGRDIYKNHPEVDEEWLNWITVHVINTVTFARILEDRGIAPENRLRNIVWNWNGEGRKQKLAVELGLGFTQLRNRFNGGVFKTGSMEKFQISDHILEETITNLYPPRSPFLLTQIPAPILGASYPRHSTTSRYLPGNRPAPYLWR